MRYEEYYDKVMGAWIGKSAGGIIGFKQENNKSLMNYTFDNVFPDRLPPNDDFDLQVLYLFEVLEKNGANFDSYDLGQVFARHNKCWANEYRVAIENVNMGINPPLSGVFNNEYFQNSMGCPIRSELWALIAPGNPDIAAEFAKMDGCVDHGELSIECEAFLSALEAEAFVENDFDVLLARNLQKLKEDSQLRLCIESVISMYENGVNWRDARNRLVKKFGSCDASYAVINVGFVFLALIYGEGDFTSSLLIAVNCGFDSDCTAATAGAIFGIMNGASGIPQEWKDKIGDKFFLGTVEVETDRDTYEDIALLTADVGIALVRDGVNNSFTVTDLPDGYKNVIPRYLNRLRVSFEYNGKPCINADGSAAIDIVLKNRSAKTEKVCLSFAPCGNFQSVQGGIEKELAAGAECVVTQKFTLASSGELFNAEKIKITVTDSVGSREFVVGFLPPVHYRLYGPYYDNFDSSVHKEDPFNSLMPKDVNGNADIFSMFNGYIDIEKQYIRNDDVQLADHDDVLAAYGNNIDIESNIGYRGPCCVYLEREIILDEPRQALLLIGNNDGFRVWLNGELVSKGDKPVYWTLQNNTALLNLKKGKNKLVYKVIRRNAPFQFSAMFSSMEFGNGVFVPFKIKDEKSV